MQKPILEAKTITRRDTLTTALGLAAAGALGSQPGQSAQAAERIVKKGRIKQSVCRWCYGKLSLDELAAASAKMGLVGIDLVGPKGFPTLKKYGLVGTMTPAGGGGIRDGLNDPGNHERYLKGIHEAIEATAAQGWRNVICMSGNRHGMDDKTGLKNCAKALKQIAPVAEKAGVILNMELLNSRVDHKDYMCDHSEWGIELVKRVGSDNFRLLYDIYHMQIMEGDVIRTIEKNHSYFGHYHTGGNPGRNELDESQELNYVPIARAIADTAFTGYVAHEFVPTRDPLTSLAEAVALCDV
jgi:hydroxypyruvate isomerase